MRTEGVLGGMLLDGQVQADLASVLLASRIPELAEQALARIWGDPNHPENDPVEDRQVHFYYLSPGTRSGAAVQKQYTGYDTQGEKIVTIMLRDEGIAGTYRLGVRGEGDFFDGLIPQDPAQTKVFVEALDRAFNNPRRPQPVIVEHRIVD